MIEKILKKSRRTFRSAEVVSIAAAEGRARVRIGGEGRYWIKTSMNLSVGDSVIVAQNEDSSRFIVQVLDKTLPSENTLLLI